MVENITHIKSGIGLSPEKQPVWFKYLDLIVSGTNEENEIKFYCYGNIFRK